MPGISAWWSLGSSRHSPGTTLKGKAIWFWSAILLHHLSSPRTSLAMVQRESPASTQTYHEALSLSLLRPALVRTLEVTLAAIWEVTWAAFWTRLWISDPKPRSLAARDKGAWGFWGRALVPEDTDTGGG